MEHLSVLQQVLAREQGALPPFGGGGEEKEWNNGETRRSSRADLVRDYLVHLQRLSGSGRLEGVESTIARHVLLTADQASNDWRLVVELIDACVKGKNAMPPYKLREVVSPPLTPLPPLPYSDKVWLVKVSNELAVQPLQPPLSWPPPQSLEVNQHKPPPFTPSLEASTSLARQRQATSQGAAVPASSPHHHQQRQPGHPRDVVEVPTTLPYLGGTVELVDGVKIGSWAAHSSLQHLTFEQLRMVRASLPPQSKPEEPSPPVAAPPAAAPPVTPQVTVAASRKAHAKELQKGVARNYKGVALNVVVPMGNNVKVASWAGHAKLSMITFEQMRTLTSSTTTAAATHASAAGPTFSSSSLSSSSSAAAAAAAAVAAIGGGGGRGAAKANDDDGPRDARTLEWKSVGTVLVGATRDSCLTPLTQRRDGSDWVTPGIVPVLALDLDGTLILPRSPSSGREGGGGGGGATSGWGQHSPFKVATAGCWQFFSPTTVRVVQWRVSQGAQLVLFSNQAGLLTGKRELAGFTRMIAEIASVLKVPLAIFCATGKDEYRKPLPGMWHLFLNMVRPALTIDCNNSASMYVGDMAGRPSDPRTGSRSDAAFAANVGLVFHTPEEAFGDPRGMEEGALERLAQSPLPPSPFALGPTTAWVAATGSGRTSHQHPLLLSAPGGFSRDDPTGPRAASAAVSRALYSSQRDGIVLVVGRPCSGRTAWVHEYLLPELSNAFRVVLEGGFEGGARTGGMSSLTAWSESGGGRGRQVTVIKGDFATVAARRGPLERARSAGLSAVIVVMDTPAETALHLSLIRPLAYLRPPTPLSLELLSSSTHNMTLRELLDISALIGDKDGNVELSALDDSALSQLDTYVKSRVVHGGGAQGGTGPMAWATGGGGRSTAASLIHDLWSAMYEEPTPITDPCVAVVHVTFVPAPRSLWVL